VTPKPHVALADVQPIPIKLNLLEGWTDSVSLGIASSIATRCLQCKITIGAQWVQGLEWSTEYRTHIGSLDRVKQRVAASQDSSPLMILTDPLLGIFLTVLLPSLTTSSYNDQQKNQMKPGCYPRPVGQNSKKLRLTRGTNWQ
jgi:hypothetical protein